MATLPALALQHPPNYQPQTQTNESSLTIQDLPSLLLVSCHCVPPSPKFKASGLLQHMWLGHTPASVSSPLSACKSSFGPPKLSRTIGQQARKSISLFPPFAPPFSRSYKNLLASHRCASEERQPCCGLKWNWKRKQKKKETEAAGIDVDSSVFYWNQSRRD